MWWCAGFSKKFRENQHKFANACIIAIRKSCPCLSLRWSCAFFIGWNVKLHATVTKKRTNVFTSFLSYKKVNANSVVKKHIMKQFYQQLDVCVRPSKLINSMLAIQCFLQTKKFTNFFVAFGVLEDGLRGSTPSCIRQSQNQNILVINAQMVLNHVKTL